MLSTSALNVVPKLVCRWPENLTKINLKREEATVIEALVEKLWQSVHTLVNGNALPGSKPTFQVVKANQSVALGNGIIKPLPRSLIVTCKCAIVILKLPSNPREDSLAYEQNYKDLVWDLIEGNFLYRKTLESEYQAMFYKHVRYGLSEKEKKGFVELKDSCTIRGVFTVFERVYPMSLGKSITSKSHKPEFNFSSQFISLVSLQNAVKIIHSLFFTPAKLVEFSKNEEKEYCYNTYEGPCFHGDISPNSIMCEPDSTYEGLMNYRLINFGLSFNPDKITWTKGWGSPETIKFAVTKTRYQNLTERQFNKEYGQKKDTWALGLIIGALLLGKLHVVQQDLILPPFACIVDKLLIAQGSIDESGLTNLKQKEIDGELERIIDSESDDPAGKNRKSIWGLVKRWLKVNPDERYDMSQAYLEIKE